MGFYLQMGWKCWKMHSCFLLANAFVLDGRFYGPPSPLLQPIHNSLGDKLVLSDCWSWGTEILWDTNTGNLIAGCSSNPVQN